MDSGIQENLRIESEMLDFGIRNPTNKLESRIQVLLTKTGIEYLESGIHSVESTIQDCLGFPHMDRNFLLHTPHQSIPELAIFKLKMKLTVLFEVCCVHFLSSNSFIKKFIQSFRLEFAHRKSACGLLMRFELSCAAKYSYYLLIFLYHVVSTIS